MYGRAGLDRFKKAQSSEPFSVTANSSTKSSSHLNASSISSRVASPPATQLDNQKSKNFTSDAAASNQPVNHGSGQSTWQPPDWAIEPLPGVYYLEVVKEGEVLDQINLDKRKHIFGRQFHTCDFVLDHQSVSRQHAAVVPHKNGSIYVIDLGSVHGTFVSNERLTKDSPTELELGQSLRFAASTRTYILRKNTGTPFLSLHPTDVDLPPSPDPSDEEAVVAYNTYINRVLNGRKRPNQLVDDDDHSATSSRGLKRARKGRVSFKDQAGGLLDEVVGFSDGADVGTEPGPVGVKEGSLVGKYESLVQITVIPKGKEPPPPPPDSGGVTEKLQQVLNRVKAATPKGGDGGGGGIYDDIYGESFSVGSSWAYEKNSAPAAGKDDGRKNETGSTKTDDDDDDDDLFG